MLCLRILPLVRGWISKNRWFLEAGALLIMSFELIDITHRMHFIFVNFRFERSDQERLKTNIFSFPLIDWTSLDVYRNTLQRDSQRMFIRNSSNGTPSGTHSDTPGLGMKHLDKCSSCFSWFLCVYSSPWSPGHLTSDDGEIVTHVHPDYNPELTTCWSP